MKKKTFNLIAGITSGVATIAEAVIAFVQPPCAGAIAASIPVAEGAIITICGNFVTE